MADVLRFDIAKDPKGNPITYGRVGDTDGLTRSVKVFEDGKPLDLTGYLITFEGNTSKYKTKVFDTDGISIVDAAKGEFNYTFPNMAFAVEGQYERAYFSFANADKRMTTADFQVIVFGNSDIDAEEAETIITEYNRLLAELHKKQDAYIEEMDQTFLSLTQQLEDLQAQIDDVVARLEAGDFYTKEESDGKFSTKTELSDHVDNKENPHGVTAEQVGLGNVMNYGIASQADAEAGTSDELYMTPAKTKQAIESKTVMTVVNLVPLNGASFEADKNLAIIRQENGVVYVELGLRLRLPAGFANGSVFASLDMPIPSRVVFKAASEASTAATCHVEINPAGNLVMWKPAAETALYHINAVAPSGLI